MTKLIIAAILLPVSWMEFAVYVIYFGVGQSLIKAFDTLIRRRSSPGLDQTQKAASLLFLANAFFMSSVLSYATGYAKDYPPLLIGIWSSMLCLGPSQRMYFHGLVDPGKKWRMVLHLAPATIMLLIEFYLQIFQRPWIIRMVDDLRVDTASHPLAFVVLGCAIHFLTYNVFLFRRQLADLRDLRGSRPGLFTMAYNLTAVSAGIYVYLAFVSSNTTAMLVPLVGVTILVIVISLMSNRHPDFFDRLKVEYKKNRYENSLLEGIDLEMVKTRLEELMVDEQVYHDYELSLKGVAEMLNIPRAKLSQFMNQHLGIDFRNYVNQYRVEEAKILLAQEEEASVLRICYMVGFQSKSAFNTAFRRQVGKTPTAYREEVVRKARKRGSAWKVSSDSNNLTRAS